MFNEIEKIGQPLPQPFSLYAEPIRIYIGLGWENTGNQ